MIFVESTWDCTVAGIAGQSPLKALSFKTFNSMRLSKFADLSGTGQPK
jgi:hypothetical protein